MNSAGQVVINTPTNVRKMARIIKQAGVKPELEIFDSGDLRLACDLIREGELDGPGLFSFVLGVTYGFAANPETMRSEEHTSELQLLIRISYADICLTKQINKQSNPKQY